MLTREVDKAANDRFKKTAVLSRIDDIVPFISLPEEADENCERDLDAN